MKKARGVFAFVFRNLRGIRCVFKKSVNIAIEEVTFIFGFLRATLIARRRFFGYL